MDAHLALCSLSEDRENKGLKQRQLSGPLALKTVISPQCGSLVGSSHILKAVYFCFSSGLLDA